MYTKECRCRAQLTFIPYGPSLRAHCSGDHARHSDTLTGEVRGGPVLKRITPSEVEQKLLVPTSLATGVPTTTNSLHSCCLQTAVMRNRKPDFVHHVPAVQLAFASVASRRPAWFADSVPMLRGSGASAARSRAKPSCG